MPYGHKIVITRNDVQARFLMCFTQVGEGRRGRESNPRIAVLQTAALPLGYPAAANFSERKLSGLGVVVSILQRGRLR